MCLHLLSVARCIKVVFFFRFFCCSFIFSGILLLVEIEEIGGKQSSNPWCVEEHIIVATHLSQTLIHSTEIDGTLSYTRSSPLLLTLDCWSISLLRYNGHVWSFCRYTRSHRVHSIFFFIGTRHMCWQRRAERTVAVDHDDVMNKAEKLWISNKQASKEQPIKMSIQLVMKFMLHLHLLPKCPELKCQNVLALSNIKQSISGRPITLHCWMTWIVSRATHWKTQRWSLLNRQQFKSIEGEVASICNNSISMFSAIRQKFSKKCKSKRLRLGKIEYFRHEMSVSGWH